MKTFVLKILLILSICLILPGDSFSQVVINEICPSNVSVIQNSNGDYDDWVEIYNAGASSVNLSGYGLTDDTLKPFRFTFPTTSLGAGQRMIVFASDSNSSVIVNHWEMAVSGTGTWKYALGSASLDTNWRNLSFNDGSWSSGPGGVGFGDGDDGTTTAVTTSVMMRKTFSIPDTSQILKCVFAMDYDDGFVAYLNGVELSRANLGIAGTRPLWNDLALSSHEANMYQGLKADSFFIDPSFLKTILRPGTNVLTVETHNVTSNSTDLSSIPYLFFGMKGTGTVFSTPPSWFLAPSSDYYNAHFKLSRTGETVYLYLPAGTIADQKTFPSMDLDNSYGRKPDGSASWCLMGTPTPNATNNTSTCYTGYASIPVVSLSGGFYATTQTLSMSTVTPGGVIRYTTNGDVPLSSDPIFPAHLTISQTQSIRARVFASGYLPSPVVTNTYFINEDIKLPVFTITTDSLNLWDYNTGIYVMGPNASSTSPYFGANFWQDWEKPANIEFYDKSKIRQLRFDADIMMYGNYSRAKAQKSFEIKLSDRYGSSSVNYPFITDKPFIDKMDDIVLRNSGTDWNVVHFRDALMERVMRTTYSGYLGTEPAVLFLNGQFWGVYTIHENHDENWMDYNFGLSKSQIDYIKEDGSSITVKDGSDVTFWTMYNYATVQNPATQAYYDYMNSVLDLKNYTDYFIAETYYNNGDWIGDWTNNIKMWRPNKTGSKWKYLLYDTDFGLGLQGSVNDNRLAIARNPAAFSHSSEMFDAMLNNPTYKRYFINRYADLINTIYLPSYVSGIEHQFEDSMAYDMPAHFAKWGSNVSTWQSNITSMMNFVSQRPTIMRDNIKTGFSLAGKVTLTLNVSPAGAGRIEISTITPESYPWSGIYFNGNPVTITAIPNPGYTFDHFRSNVVINSNNYNQSVTYNYTANDQITAYFTGSPVAVQLTVSELNYNSDSAMDAGDWVELHNFGTQALNLSGWKISDAAENHMFQFPTGTVIPGGGYLVIMEDSAKFIAQFPSVSNRIGELGFNYSNAGEELRLFDHTGALYLSFTYSDLAPWPITADGGGYTCELLSQTGDLNDGNNWFAGCIGGSPGRAYSPLLSVPVNVSGNTTFCTGGGVVLSASSDPSYTYQWKRNGSTILGAINPTYTATQAGNYTVVVSSLGCSVVSDPVVVTVVTQSPDPVTEGSWRCGAGTLTLAATASDSVFWYDAASGGNLLGIGSSFETPFLTATTIYYARTSRACPSNAVSALAQVLQQTAAPVTNDVTRCGPGIATLTASDTAVIHWYNDPIGGGLLETGTTFVTNYVSNDTVFYVEAGSLCPSPRIEVRVFISSTAAPAVSDNSRCGSGTVDLTAVSTAPVSWYNVASGGSAIGTGLVFTTPVLAATDTFYAEANSGCPSPRVRAIAIIDPTLAAPTGTDGYTCDPGSVTLSATSTEQVYWYDAMSGGNLLYTGSIFQTPYLTTTTTYYAEAGYDCRSPRTPVVAAVNTTPAAPVTTDGSRCGPGTVILSGVSPELISWYDASSGGNLLFTGDMFTTPSISVTTTYYAEAGTTCRSLSRSPAQAVVNAVPSPPVSSNVSRCGSGSVVLTATSPETIYWYSASTGGTLLGTGPSYTTPSLSSSTTYYVETGNLCRSTRISVQAIIAVPPAAPTASNVSRCGPGTLTLTASSPEQIYWYDASVNGNLLFTGSSYTTPSITTTTAYYAEAGNTCRSLTRTTVQAIVNTLPAAPTGTNVSRCGPGAVTLTASSPEQVYWFSVSSGGTQLSTGSVFTTPSISSTTTYYAEAGNTCRSASRTAIQAIINAVPASPVTSNVSRCGTGSVTLTATSPETIYWYNAASGGTLLFTGTTYTTPVLSATTTYYVEAGNNCRSVRVPVQAVIGAIPAAPTASNVSRCGPGTVTLTASSPEQIYWYDAAVNGTLLSTGSSYTTSSLGTTTTYYAEAGNTCRSLTRTSVQAIISPIPSAPTGNNVSRCGSGTVTLTASSPEQIYWFSAASGGTQLATGSSYTTPVLSTTTTYYAEAGNTCRSSTRTAIQAIISVLPAAPTTSDVSRCGPGPVTLTASSPETIYWYDAASGGTLLATGASFTTASLSSTTTFYVEAGTTCRSIRVAVQAIIGVPPAAPTSSNVSRCGTGSVTLTASSPEQIYWYDASVNGTLLGTGSSYSTSSLGTTTTFYAEAGNLCRSLTRTPVQAIINPIPAPPSGTDVSRCGPGQVTLTASSPEQIYWYSTAAGGTLLYTGSSYTTPSITVSTTYYAETGNTCRSTTRTALQAIITSAPAVPVVTDGSRCGAGSVLLAASSPAQVNWFDVAVGGVLLDTGATFTTPVLSVSTTFYAEAGTGCNSARVPVQAVVNTLPVPPLVTDASRCGPGTLTLSATAPESIYWYDQSAGGTLLGSGNSFTTPVLNSTTVYYVETGDLCRSNRAMVQAIVNAIPSPPVASDVSHCGPGMMTLTASSPEQIYWYDASVGGSLLGTGPAYTTPSLFVSTTYYVEAGDVCRSARIAVQALIDTVPTAPVVTDGSRCGPGTIVLAAIGQPQVNWYDSLTGGNYLGSGFSFTTPLLSSTTVFYADAGLGCNSIRVPVQAVVVQLPASPIAIDDSSCGGGVMTLQASATDSLYWYDAGTGGNLIGSGSSYITPFLTSTTVYYVETGSLCRSLRTPVNAIVNPVSADPVVTGASNCGPGSVELSATSLDPVTWYDQASGGNVVGTGSTFTTPVLTSSTIYYAVSGTTCPSAAVAASALIFPLPVVSLGPDTVVIQSGDSVVLDAGSGFLSYQWSTTETTQSITIFTSGLYSVQVSDVNSCTANDQVFVSVVTGTLQSNDFSGLSVSPNPTHSMLSLVWYARTAEKAEIRLLDVFGRLLMFRTSQPFQGLRMEHISMEGYTAGAYFIELRQGNSRQLLKVIRQ